MSDEEQTARDGVPLWRPRTTWRGRKRLLTQDVGDTLLEAFATGASVTVAAERAGISKTQVYDWLSMGERDDVDPGYQAFSEATKEARGEAAFYALKQIANGVDKWQAAAWLLERRYPEDYALKKDLVPPGTVTIVMPNGHAYLPPTDADDAIPPELLDE